MSHSLTWLDLCSGLGGASQPALDRGWKVIRVDIDPRFKPDIVADVRALPLRDHKGTLWIDGRRVDVLWASPPCQDFARAKMPWLIKRYPKLKPDLSIVRAVKEANRLFSPKFWVIENTTHSRHWLTPLLGPVLAAISGHIFWGRIPCLLPQVERVPKQSLWPREDRAAQRAKIPYEIGEAICRAVEAR